MSTGEQGAGSCGLKQDSGGSLHAVGGQRESACTGHQLQNQKRTWSKLVQLWASDLTSLSFGPCIWKTGGMVVRNLAEICMGPHGGIPRGVTSTQQVLQKSDSSEF